MCECRGDYEAEMQAQQEAEGQYNQEQEYQEYLDSLAKDRNYELLSLEIVTDILNGKSFLDSGKTAAEFLDDRKKDLMFVKEIGPDNQGEEYPF